MKCSHSLLSPARCDVNASNPVYDYVYQRHGKVRRLKASGHLCLGYLTSVTSHLTNNTRDVDETSGHLRLLQLRHGRHAF